MLTELLIWVCLIINKQKSWSHEISIKKQFKIEEIFHSTIVASLAQSFTGEMWNLPRYVKGKERLKNEADPPDG